MTAVTSIVVRPAADGDIEGAWHCLDVVAREKAYLSQDEIIMAVAP